SPRQPRRLVIVLPTLAALFAPLPLLVALGGIVALRLIARGRRPAPIIVGFVAAADVIWCATTLLSKQLQLVPEALLEPTAVAYWLIVVAALGPPLVLMVVLPRRARACAPRASSIRCSATARSPSSSARSAITRTTRGAMSAARCCVRRSRRRRSRTRARGLPAGRRSAPPRARSSAPRAARTSSSSRS